MRTITQEEPVTWIWDVRSLKPGRATVVLDLFSHLKTGKEDEPVQMRVLQETWRIEAHGLERVKYWIVGRRSGDRDGYCFFDKEVIRETT